MFFNLEISCLGFAQCFGGSVDWVWLVQSSAFLTSNNFSLGLELVPRDKEEPVPGKSYYAGWGIVTLVCFTHSGGETPLSTLTPAGALRG